MVGTEFRKTNNKPDKDSAKAVIQSCLDSGLLLLSCGTWDNTVRWIPPLNTTKEQIGGALDIYKSALQRLPPED